MPRTYASIVPKNRRIFLDRTGCKIYTVVEGIARPAAKTDGGGSGSKKALHIREAYGMIVQGW